MCALPLGGSSVGEVTLLPVPPTGDNRTLLSVKLPFAGKQGLSNLHKPQYYQGDVEMQEKILLL